MINVHRSPFRASPHDVCVCHVPYPVRSPPFQYCLVGSCLSIQVISDLLDFRQRLTMVPADVHLIHEIGHRRRRAQVRVLAGLVVQQGDVFPLVPEGFQNRIGHLDVP